MKTKIIISTILAFICTSCGDDFLDRTPHSQANVADFYRTPDDIEVAVNGAYRTLQYSGQYGQAIWVIGEIASDNSIAGRPVNPYQDIGAHQIPSTNGVVEDGWYHNYQGIQAVNTLLNRMQDIEFTDQQRRNQLEGEAKFLRALMYFNLVRVYGDVPLVLTETSSVEEGYEQGRTPTEQVYEQIIQDLSDADTEGYLPWEHADADKGRATKGAAKALFGKVYLTLHDFQQAANYLGEVIDANVYDLLENYEDVFDIDNANHAESVFEVQFKKGTGQDLGSNFFHVMSPFTAGSLITGVGSGSGFGQPSEDMITSYEENDLRKDVSLQEGFTNEDGEFIPEPWISKYIDPSPFAQGDNDNNFPVIRYADVLLMYAEALNELGYEPDGDAFMYLNLVRNRASLDDLSNQEVPDQQSFRLAIEEERRHELAFEGHRWFDLVRTGRLLPVMNSKGYDLEEYQRLFPVPQSQIDVNPDLITQNEGHDL